jgi:hypothetical protein
VLKGAGANLLHCYAVECGLKAALLRRVNKSSTKSLASTLTSGGAGHDLRLLAAHLNLAVREYSDIIACRRSAPSRDWIGSSDVHQAWRYGAALRADDESSATSSSCRPDGAIFGWPHHG